jgi:ABC-type uncharacterized transport system permease subunit
MISAGVTMGTGAVVKAVAGTAPAILATGVTAGASTVIVDAVKTKRAKKMECAPTNFFDIVEALITQASYWLLLLFAVPMVLGWILPGPLERKKAK